MKKYNFEEVEKEISEFWEKNNIYSKIKKLCEKGENFYFLDGPPYTNGKVHIGTAWNKSLKDMVLRYKRMKRFNVFDRAGYDMHGLPTEQVVEKKLKLKTKEDILKYGVDKFILECKKFCIEMMNLMTKDFKRLGVWMDFENAYQPITQEFIDGEWMLIKTAHEKNRLYEGLRTMTWCGHCATALAKHECEYKNVSDDSIFVKFKVKGKENLYLIIWTTTPWTIPFNLAIMANPEIDYVEADVKGERWIIAKALAGPIIQGIVGTEVKIIKEFKGEKLKGMRYIHPFHKDIPHYKEMELQHLNIHTVVISEEYVDVSAGSGLVHCAPGCGPEDYEVGVRNNLPPYNNIDQYGAFPNDMGKFGGKIAKIDDNFFVEELKKEGALIYLTPVEHEYAHCWRCHKPVIFRTTKQWFFKVEDLKEEMIRFNKDIYWVPKAAFNAFHSWLSNLRDNSITKQRFWGTPLPIWRCENCENYIVVGSRKELESLAKGKLPQDLHKPWIDSVEIPCECGHIKRRIPDIIDVWVDAGTTSWNALDYPHTEEKFKRLFPADFILEGKDQIRGWFNLLMVSSVLAFGKPSFKNVYMHGFVNDAQGRKMSKSLGNYILPEEVINKYGADTFRYYTISAANPGVDLNYNFNDVDIKFKNLNVLWNLHNLILEMHSVLKVKLKRVEKEELELEDLYIFSRLHSTIEQVSERMNKYLLNEVPILIEELYLDLSRNYVKFIRDRKTEKEREKTLFTMFSVMLELLKMFSIISPFISEKIYQNLKDVFNLKEESIHLFEWPKVDDTLQDIMLEDKFRIVMSVISSILSIRDEKGIGVRWPLKEVYVECEEEYKKDIELLKHLILAQTNVKNLKFGKKEDDLEKKEFIKGNIYLNIKIDKEMEEEGFAREIIRRIQSMRKQKGLTKDQEIELELYSPDLKKVVERYNKEILEKTNSKKIVFSNSPTGETFKIKDRIISIKF